MSTYYIPDTVSEVTVEAVLDRHWKRGFTYPKGDQEDYSRVWYDDVSRVEYLSVLIYATALLKVDETSIHFAELKEELQLRDLNQTFDDAQNTRGVGRYRKIMHLGCMVARNEIDESFDQKLGELWSELLNSAEVILVAVALAAAPLLHKSSEVKKAVRRMNTSGWEEKLDELEMLWQRAEKPTLLPTRDIDRLVSRSAEALAASDFEAAFEAAQSAVDENEYSDQAQVLRARALDGMGDHWGAWAAMESARTYSSEDTSDFDRFIELHRNKIETGSVAASDASRKIALELLHSFQMDIDHVLGVFYQHDQAWRSRWIFAMHMKGMLDDPSELFELEPESYMSSFLRGNYEVAEGNVPAALIAWERWHQRPEFEADSFDAWALELFIRVNYTEPSIAAPLFGLIKMHAGKKEWPDVVRLAHFWSLLEPESVESLVWKGIGHTGMLESEQAIQAYDKAIEIHFEQGDSMLSFGEDPIAAAHFNRACERANNGLLDTQVFEDLEAAVHFAPRFATDARADDYLKACWGDPRFEAAIAAGLEAAHKHDEFGGHPEGCGCGH